MIETGLTIELEELIEDLSTEDRIKQFDAFLIGMEQVECPLDEQFAPNLYLRERFVPAGTLFSTYTWKTEHPFFCSMGELLIWQDDKGWEVFKAPCRGLTKAGTKRIVYAVTDVVWTTIHYNKTNTRDPKKLHDMLFENYCNEFVDLPELKAINRCQEL